MSKSKAEQAGISFADCIGNSIINISNLLYNERRKRLFCKGFIERINEIMDERMGVNV